MTKVLTGEIINTSFGEILLYNDQELLISVGDTIIISGTIREVTKIHPPSMPGGKWALGLKQTL